MAERDLPPFLIDHAGECPACAEILNESRRMSAMILDAAATPSAPDCRAAVLQRVRGHHNHRPVLAYAFAVLALVAIVVAGAAMLARGPHQSPRPTVVRHDNQHNVVPPIPAAPKQIVHDANPVVPPVIRNTSTQIRHTHGRAPHARNVQPTVAHVDTATPPVERKPQLVFATWTKQRTEPDISYSYTIQNETTGETVTCSAQGSGKSVKVYLACTHVDPSENKGEIHNE